MRKIYFTLALALLTSTGMQADNVNMKANAVYDEALGLTMPTMFAVPQNGDPSMVVTASKVRGEELRVFKNLEEGQVYDFLALYTQDEAPMLFIAHEGVTAEADKVLTFDAAEATVTVVPRFVTPTGQEIGDGNCAGVSLYTFFYHDHCGLFTKTAKSILAIYDTEQGGVKNWISRYGIKANGALQHFSFEDVGLFATPEGMCYIQVPFTVGNADATPSNEAANYVEPLDPNVVQPAFQQQIINAKDGNYQWGNGFVTLNGMDQFWRLDCGTIAENIDNWNLQRINLCTPANYNGPLGIAMRPCYDPIISYDNALEAPITTYTPGEGWVYRGISIVRDNLMACNAEGNRPLDGDFERLHFAVTPEVKLGAGVPAFVWIATMDEENNLPTFDFDFVGRYGERRTRDAFDYAERGWVDENPMTYKLTIGDNTFTSHMDFSYYQEEWMEAFDEDEEFRVEEPFTLDIVNRNCALAEGVEGSNTIHMEWDSSRDDQFPPTLTMLQLRNSKDQMADQFATADDGVLEFCAGDFTPTVTEYWTRYFNFQPIHEITVEVAPHGSNQFTAMSEVNNIANLHYEPGFGDFFRVPLGQTSAINADGWYDLRITLADEAGNLQQQTLAPAFQIASATGITTTNKSHAATYYDLTGRKVAQPNHGVYMKVSEGKTQKVAFQ